MTSSLLSTRLISMRFGGIAALEDVTLTLERGQTLGLLGPNGAGKTTLVNVLTGFVRPTSGAVLLDGVPVSGMRPDQLALRGIVRTFQSVRLFKRMSVLQNVLVPAHASHGGIEAAERALDFVGIAGLAARQAGSLPYTQERLVGVARALALAPAFLLMDEPAAGMNDAEGAQLVDLIRRIPPAYGCGLLLIEHNMPVVMAVCSDLHVLRQGRTLMRGPRDEVRANREFIDSYLGGL
jgi:branched-chain amino acid transport system ATP-binding protein